MMRVNGWDAAVRKVVRKTNNFKGSYSWTVHEAAVENLLLNLQVELRISSHKNRVTHV